MIESDDRTEVARVLLLRDRADLDELAPISAEQLPADFDRLVA